MVKTMFLNALDFSIQKNIQKDTLLHVAFQKKGFKGTMDVIQRAQEQMKSIEDSGIDSPSQIEKQIKLKMKNQTNTNSDMDNLYINQGIRFPLEYKRFGQLPLVLEEFIGFDNKSCFSNISKRTLK